MTASKKPRAELAVAPPEWQPAEYEKRALPFVKANRLCAWRWARQKRKSTNLSKLALYAMMKKRGELVTYASASLLLGGELIVKETGVLQAAFRWARAVAEQAKMKLELADGVRDKILGALSDDDFAKLYEAQKAEFRLYHDRTSYSRTKIIAPNPATARGWSGWVLLDEVSFIRDFKLLMDGVLYIINANREFRLVMATTDPEDDTHPSVEMLREPIGTKFQANPLGNIYESAMGIPVFRVSIFDSSLAGVPVYDLKSGETITPAQSYERSPDKDSWNRNEGLIWVAGGTAAVPSAVIETAQHRGVGQCAHVAVADDLDFERALDFLRTHLTDGPVTLGMDQATTTNEKSNPTAVTVLERKGLDLIHRLIVTWKTDDISVNETRIGQLLDAVDSRAAGGRAKAMGIDASNERLAAGRYARKFGPRLPVTLFVNSETADVPGYAKPVNWKQALGDAYVAELNDNHCWLPPEEYIKKDYRLVRKEKGAFDTKVNEAGMHADTFDSSKNARRVMYGAGETEARAVRVGGPTTPRHTGRNNPLAPHFDKTGGSKLWT